MTKASSSISGPARKRAVRTQQALIDIALLDQTPGHGFRQLLERIFLPDALDIRARQDALAAACVASDDTLWLVKKSVMLAPQSETTTCLKPHSPRRIPEEPGISAAGLIVQALVRAHDLAHVRLLDQGLEGRGGRSRRDPAG